MQTNEAPEAGVDLSKAKTGDTVRFRCGGEAKVHRAEPALEGDGRYYLVFEGSSYGIRYSPEGHLHNCHERSENSVFSIVELIPAPFDWATAKPGMAVRPGAPTQDKDKVWWIVGPAFGVKRDDRCFVVTNDQRMLCSDSLHFAFVVVHRLTRAPEHDIEVEGARWN